MSVEQDLQDKRLKALLRHVDNVRMNCLRLGEILIEDPKIGFGKDLIALGYIHDNSKFHGIEWEYLHSDMFGGEHSDKLALAIKQHTTTNPHHPEYWGSIHDMPEIYVAEMVCDWAARSSEFGNDLRAWIKDKATKKFDMTVQSKAYKDIKRFVDMFLDPAFK